MLLLAIDTAGPCCAAAVALPGGNRPEILAQASEWLGRGHAERLMPMIEAVLAGAGLTYADLQRIAVTTGPGSFTGVRVGVAAARALGLALAVPAVGIGSLAAIAVAARQGKTTGTAVAALDANRGEIFAQAQDIPTGSVLLAPTAAPPGTIAKLLDYARRPLILTGGGAPLLAACLSADFLVAGAAESPDIAEVVTLGLCADPSESPVPLYIRGADAKPQAGKALARV